MMIDADAARVTEELTALENGAVDLAAFPHAEHVRFAYHMLARYPFAEALVRFSRGLKLLVGKAGKPEVYNETVTVAFLAVIGERRRCCGDMTWGEFSAANPELLDKGCLARWYTPEELKSDTARRTFVLPRVR